jgi:N4-gp56 family major capsid protein
MAYAPAGNLTTSAGLAHLQSIYYKKRALDRLQKKFVFRMACEKDMIPKQVGRSVQFFRYTNFSANTTETTEGTVGSSLTLSSRILNATVSQYTAFITVSDLLKDTAIDPIVQQAGELLGYQAGLSVDTITRGVIDAESASTNQALLSTYLRVSDLRNARHQMQAVDVQPFDDGEFLVFAHPYATYDLVNDPNAMGLADIGTKYNPGFQQSALVKYEDRGTVAHVAGCKVIESTNVKTQTTPNRYRAYVFGKGAVACVDLEGRGPSDVRDPRKQRFNINVIPGKKQIADPEGVIGAAVSYNFVFTNVVLEGPAGIGGSYRYRTLDPQSTIG